MSAHTCTPPGDSAEDILGVAYDLRCAGCVELLVHMHGPMLPAAAFDARSTVERETIARVVAWLRRDNSATESLSGAACRVLADAIERGDWKEGTNG